MSPRKPENTKGKSGRKKLTLSKETVKDLTPKGEADEALKGGRVGTTTWWVSCGC